MTMGSGWKIYALAAGAATGAAFVVLGCSSAPIKVECSELRTRLAYENLSDDQIRFVQQELDECEGRVRAADAKDSALIDSTEKRFTPQE